ncbi:MAG TPA: hypothetical protein DIW81_30190 [Planctomycetaceae bacterium]|uniref:hypothetical protein n=1 Tax=Rubinisphaera sp. TaxID=2024857 RepID=UPI000C103AFB|nr:hypothetical protein [Rubinisphaera sp.]MBV09109.1 hypothetical protein [Rubinisphaera sp.]HCS55811.1 hypothetical protein [Planctomycetaceae bacterium]|tara:strand:+ start:130 stop:582 length:453 start_codon:yes stop_codon:yes gene_type:complete
MTLNDSKSIKKRYLIISLGRVFVIWLILIAAEIIHGILRAVTLAPLVGEFRSNQIGVFTGSVIILVIAYLTIRWIGAKQPRELLLVGLVWWLLTVAFEVMFGRIVMGMSWERIASDYNIFEGGLMPLGLLVLFLSPMIALKLRSSRFWFD